MSTLAAVAAKELRVFFGSALAYAAGTVFLVLAGFFFSTNLAFFVAMGGFDLGRGFWQYQFHDLQRVLLLIAPLFTMRLFAEERRQGTLDLLLSYPIPEAALVLGKYGSALVALLLLLLASASHALLLAAVARIDAGPVLAGYLGLFLLGAAFLACGLLVSALTASQLVAASVTFAALLLFWALTWNHAAAGPGLFAWLDQVSLFDRFALFARGAVDTKDVAFFVLFVAFFLFATEIVLESRRGPTEAAGVLATTPRIHVALVVTLALGIAALTQAIAERHSRRLDLTPTRALSLSERSRAVLRALADGVEATAFVSRDGAPAVAEQLALFHGAEPRFRYELVDLDRHPGRARREHVERYGLAVLRYRDARVVVAADREASITAGLVRLLRGRPARVLFVEGHGERGLDDAAAPHALGRARQAIAEDGYEVARAPRLGAGALPSDADLVIVAGPRSDLLEAESASLEHYLDAGGHVVALVDPVPLANLGRLFSRHGIETPLAVVRDRVHQLAGTDAEAVAVPTYFAHPIAASSRTPALFLTARPVEAVGAARPVAASDADAVASRDIDGDGTTSSDRAGPVPLVAAAAWPAAAGEARLVVIGDSDFATNGLLDLLGNRDLLLNAVAWGVGAGDVLGARAVPEPASLPPLSPLALTRRQSAAIFVASVVVLPSLVVLAGVLVALRARRRGARS